MPEGFEEIGQGDRFGHGGHPRGKEGNRVVDPADQQHEAHQGPGSDIGEVKGVTERGQIFILEKLEREVTSPLAKGASHGVVGELEFIQGLKERFLRKSVWHREMPAIRKVVGTIEPERVIGLISRLTGTKREDLLKKGKRNDERGLLMEMLYRQGGDEPAGNRGDAGAGLQFR